jgi:hypothetical protein
MLPDGTDTFRLLGVISVASSPKGLRESSRKWVIPI